MNENGNESPKVDQIVLTLKRDPWELTIEGTVENLNLAIAMLNEAQRTFDLRWRAGAALEMQAAQRQSAAEHERVRSILDRNQRKQ